MTDSPSSPPPGSVPPRVREALSASKFWVRLCSVMSFLVMVYFFINGFLLFGSGADPVMAVLVPRGLQVLLGCFCLVIVLWLLGPGILLWRYASRIARMLETDNIEHMEDALEAQKSFWMFIGISALILLVLSVCTILLVVVLALIGMIVSR